LYSLSIGCCITSLLVRSFIISSRHKKLRHEFAVETRVYFTLHRGYLKLTWITISFVQRYLWCAQRTKLPGQSINRCGKKDETSPVTNIRNITAHIFPMEFPIRAAFQKVTQLWTMLNTTGKSTLGSSENVHAGRNTIWVTNVREP
jgi:hypothetical protein